MSSKPTDLEVMASEGQIDALDELISENMGLYVHIATSFMPSDADPSELEDLVQEGLAKITATISKFDPYRGKWKYWSGMTCRKGIVEYLESQYATVRHPRGKAGFYTEWEDGYDKVEPNRGDIDNIVVRDELSRLLEMIRLKMPEAYPIVVMRMSGTSYRQMKRDGMEMSRERASTLYSEAVEYMRSATMLTLEDITPEEE